MCSHQSLQVLQESMHIMKIGKNKRNNKLYNMYLGTGTSPDNAEMPIRSSTYILMEMLSNVWGNRAEQIVYVLCVYPSITTVGDSVLKSMQ